MSTSSNSRQPNEFRVIGDLALRLDEPGGVHKEMISKVIIPKIKNLEKEIQELEGQKKHWLNVLKEEEKMLEDSLKKKTKAGRNIAKKRKSKKRKLRIRRKTKQRRRSR